MSRLLALSFDTPASPSITLKAGASSPEHPLPAGWGMAWYPPGDRGAMIVKDPGSVADFAMARLLRSWSRFRSTTFLCQLYGAAERRRHEDTQPFVRIFGDRQWALSHNGYLTKSFATDLPLGDDPAFEPLGHTDSEHLLCFLLNRLRSMGIRRLPDVGWDVFHGWLRDWNRLGTMNLLLTDGDFLVAYQDATGHNPLHWARRKPPHASTRLEDDEMVIDLDDPLGENRTAVLVTTRPFAIDGTARIPDGEMLVIRRGDVVWRSVWARPLETTAVEPARPVAVGAVGAPPSAAASPDAAERTYRIEHTTVYRYERPVEVSQHVLHLRPVSDRHQEVIDFTLDVAPAGVVREFEDVFGNQSLRLDIDTPFTEMRIESRITTRVLEPLYGLDEPGRRGTLPLPLMPWQREMMAAYLLPPELPAAQLQELNDYAMSFAERQDFDLVATLQDLNGTIWRDWVYEPGMTTLETTPWEVYATRRGVCQDFANLLICVARLLGIPARYRAGYIFTGDTSERRRQSEASHAWAELYLPYAGWRGFDPTNGAVVGLDHVRVACGRNFRDAAPTSGTIYRGGGRETLEIAVRVERAEVADLVSKRRVGGP